MNPAYDVSQTFTHRTATHDIEIAWTSIGDSSNPPLVFIHGTPWSSFIWHDLTTALKSRYCIYLYDHPGFGKSPQGKPIDGKPAELDPSLEIRAQASAALFKYWKLKQPPHVVAHDNGGLVSLRLFLQHGINFSSLCLIDVVAIGPFGKPFFKTAAENEHVFQSMPANFMEGFVRAYVKSAAHTPLPAGIEDALCEQWIESGSQGQARFTQEMIQAHNRKIGEIEERYSQVGEQINVKIIWGKEDTWLPYEAAERLGKALNAKEVVLVDDASHLIHYDQPTVLGVEVALWLAQQHL